MCIYIYIYISVHIYNIHTVGGLSSLFMGMA